MADAGQTEQDRVPEEQGHQGSPLRRFLRQVGARMGSVVSNPMMTVWDSTRRDERRKRERDY
jgi:hypothetical protein